MYEYTVHILLAVSTYAKDNNLHVPDLCILSLKLQVKRLFVHTFLFLFLSTAFASDILLKRKVMFPSLA